MTNRRPLPTAVTKVVVALATAALCVISAAPTVSAAPFAYIANSGSNTVSVIDGATNTVVATLPVGAGPSHVAFAPESECAFVACSGADSVAVVVPARREVVATLPARAAA